MMRVANLLILLIAVLMTSCFKDDESESLGETSKFLPGDGIVTYSGYAPLADRPVRIHFHIPANGDMKKMPMLFVFPGLERNAADYLNAWRTEASNRNVMVFVFEFPTESISKAVCFREIHCSTVRNGHSRLSSPFLILSGKIPVLRGLNMICGDILPERSLCTGM